MAKRFILRIGVFLVFCILVATVFRFITRFHTGASIPRGSPQLIYFVSSERINSLADVYLLELDRGVATQLTQGGQIRTAVWSQDGERLALQYEPSSYNQVSIFLLNVTTGELTSLFTLNLNVALLQWTPDGTKLIFEANRSGFGTNASVMAYDLNTAQLVTLAKEGSAPSVSPDGRTIAFSAKHTDDVDREIYLMDIDGSNVRRLLQHTGEDAQPSWSPDGQHLIIDNPVRDGTWGGVIGGAFWLVNADGGDLTLLREHDTYDFPRWSPDGKQILYHTTFQDMCLLKIDGKDERCITDARGGVWSLDATQIAYNTAHTAIANSTICTVSVATLADKQCFTTIPKGYAYSWRP